MSIYFTNGINARVADDNKFSKFVTQSIKRHFNHDWSECGNEDAESNEQSLKDGSRIFSVYNFNETKKIWIITEAEPYRDRTTVLFPDEY